MQKFVFCLLIFKFVTSEIETEIEQHLKDLSEQTDRPIKNYLANLITQFENINFTSYQHKTSDVIELNIGFLDNRVQSISEIFTDLGIDLSTCEEILQDQVDQIVAVSKDEIMNVLVRGYLTGKRVISDATNIFSRVRNKTLEMRQEVDNCLSLFDTHNCLIEALTRIIVMQYSLPKLIESVGEFHDEIMSLIESDVLSGMEKITFRASNSYRDIMNDFVVCVLKFF